MSSLSTQYRYKSRDVPLILRAVAHSVAPDEHRNVFCVKVSPNDSVRASLATPFETPLDQDLGRLSCLPPEMLLSVCLLLDIRSCIAFRQTNRAARQAVSMVFEYEAVMKNAFGVVKALIHAGMASRVTAPQLYHLLCSHECMVCRTVLPEDNWRFLDSRAPRSKPKISAHNDSVLHMQAVQWKHHDAANDDVKTASNVAKNSNTGTPASRSITRSTTSNNNSNSNSPDSTKLLEDPVLSGELANNNKGHDGGNGSSHNSAREKSAGLFLFLPTLTRCCKPCLEESPRLRVVPFSMLQMHADVHRREFSDVLCAPLFRQRRGFQHHTVAKHDAARVLFDLGFPARRVKDILVGSGYFEEFSWVKEIPERNRFTTILPFLDRKGNTTSQGFFCKGCISATACIYGRLTATLEYTNRLYSTKEAFMAHFTTCRAAIDLWRQARCTSAAGSKAKRKHR